MYKHVFTGSVVYDEAEAFGGVKKFYSSCVHGICFYYNEIEDKIVKELTEYLSKLFGGKILFRQTRVFLQGSKVVFDPKSIGKLANDLSLKFNVPVEITIELEKISDEEITENNFNFPAKKVLPIVGTD